MLIFNVQALIAGAAGIAAAIGTAVVTKSQTLNVIVGLLVAIAVDIWMRYYSEDCDRPLIHPSAGGHVWFVPVWLVGIIMMVISGLAYFKVV